MRAKQTAATFLTCILLASGARALSPPQYTLQSRLAGSFGASPLVVVGEVIPGENGDLISVWGLTRPVAEGLAFILQPYYNFGGIEVTVVVRDRRGRPVDPPPVADAREARARIAAALRGNPYFAGIEGPLAAGDYALLVEIAPAVIQYWDDNIGDPNGHSHEVAADVFEAVKRSDLLPAVNALFYTGIAPDVVPAVDARF